MKLYQLRPITLAVILLCSSYAAYAADTEDVAVQADSEQKAQANKDLGVVNVVGERTGIRDAAGHSRVYEGDISTVYSGKEEVERFKGSNPADVFRGMVGVNSGDARNSGALDPNVRGIQGQGRVPLTVDGTEQAVTVYRGYNGANNRNYIDPMLIGGITVEKGPSLTRGVASSVGGGVAIKTLSADDVILPGKDWGIDIKVEGSTNAAKPRFPDLQYGSTVQANPYQPGYNFNTLYDKALMIDPATGGQNSFGHDFAYRLAAAKKWQDFDVMFAYVARKKGNHFAGTGGADNYRLAANLDQLSEEERKNFWNSFTKNLANVYRPGAEVPNTSTDMQSVLLKTTWKPTDNQSLQLGVRHTWGSYGEIMPSRLAFTLGEMYRPGITCSGGGTSYDPSYCAYRDSIVNTVPQWPESEIKLTAINLEHKWNPENPYINLETNLWTTRTNLDTYTSGGFPRENYQNSSSPLNEFWRNTALTNSQDNRWGITTSNKLKLTPKLDLTLGGSYQYENLDSKDTWYNDPVETENPAMFRTQPRVGSRKEWDMSFRFDWRPTDWLELSAGARKTGYSSYDEKLARLKAEKKLSDTNTVYAYEAIGGLKLKTPQELQDLYAKYLEAKTDYEEADASVNGPLMANLNNATQAVIQYVRTNSSNRRDWAFCQSSIDRLRLQCSLKDDSGYQNLWNQRVQANDALIQGRASLTEYENLRKDANDNYYQYKKDYIIASQNDFPDIKVVEELVGGKGDDLGRMEPVVYAKPEFYVEPNTNGKFSRSSLQKYHDLEAKGAYTTGWSMYGRPIQVPAYTDPRRGNSGSWQPVLSASVRLGDNARVYARYAKTQRNPSIFESTMGFSSNALIWPLKPEKGTNIELGYTHDFSELLGADRYADLKIAYFNNTIKDVIDRDSYFNLYNLDKQKISGLELQSRYDNGKFFADFSANYYLENKVCDESLAVQAELYYQRPVPNCVKGGFTDSYLRNMAPPKYSLNLTLGGRFLDEKLEVGSRLIFQKGAQNYDDKNFGRNADEGLNVPIYWKNVTTLDAWISYKFKNNLTAEIVGTNLTNRYYLDPLTRSYTPAPGRTIRVGITKKW